MKRWLAFAPLAALVLMGVLFAGYSLKRNPQVQPSAMVGHPVPDLTLPVLETGRPMAIRQAAALRSAVTRSTFVSATAQRGTPSHSRIATCSTVCGIGPSSAATTSNAKSIQAGSAGGNRTLDLRLMKPPL